MFTPCTRVRHVTLIDAAADADAALLLDATSLADITMAGDDGATRYCDAVRDVADISPCLRAHDVLRHADIGYADDGLRC